MSSNESSSSPHYNSTTRSFLSPSSTSPPPPSPNSVPQDGTETQDRTQKPTHKLNLKLKKSSGNIASFLCSSKETGLLKELTKKLPLQTETAIPNHSAPVGPISEERPRPKTAGIRKVPIFPPPRKANSMDQIATATQEHSPNMASESSFLSEHFDAMAHISPNHVSQPSSSSTSSSHTDILFGDSESVSQTDDPLTMKTPNDRSLEASKLTTKELVTPAIPFNEGISMKKPLPPRPQPVGRSPSNSSNEELRQERFDSKHPLDTASMSKPVPKPRLRLQKASTVPDVAAGMDDTDSLQDQPHSAGANIQHSESHIESGMETIKEPVVGELKYENEVLKHQIFHLKDQRSRLADENLTLREEITQLQGSGEFGSPKPTPPPRKNRTPAVQTQTPVTKSSPTYSDQTQTKMPSESSVSADDNSVMDKPVSRRPPPSPPSPYRPSTSAPSLPPVKPARLPRQRSVPKLSSSEPPDPPISEIPPPPTTTKTTQTTTTQTTTTTTSPQTPTNGSPTPKPKFVHHQEGSRVAEDGGGRLSPQKPKPTATSRPIPIPRSSGQSSSVPERQEAEEVTVDDEMCEIPAAEVKVPVRPIAPPHVRLGAVYKKVAIKPDESWIKRKRLDSDEDGGDEAEHSQLVVQSPRRPNIPYRSHPILPPSTSPTPPSSFSPALPRSSNQQPATNVISEKSETSITAALDLKQIRPQRHPESQQADIQRRRHSSIVKSNSDDSVSGSLQREAQSALRMKQTGMELRQNGNDAPPKKPPRLRAKQQAPNLEDPNFRPISMIADIKSPETSFQEKEFGVSCTLPHGIQPEKALHKSLRMKRQPKTSSPLMEGNGKHKSKGFLGRFKSKTQYAKPEAPPLEEEGEEDGSDSDDQKGGTIKSMPMLRRVSRVKSFRASSIEEESEPEYHQLFEYAFVVGLKEDPTTGKLSTEMKYMFPPASGLVFSGKDAALQSIPQFCFPDIDRWKPTATYSSETFSFVLTDIEGSKRFGYCRRLLPAGSGPRLPEVYCIVSPLGCFSLYAKILDHMEERRTVSSSAVFAFLKAIVANPFPRPGRRVEVKMFGVKGSDMETVVFTRPMDSRLEHVDFSMLFSTLSRRKIIQLFSSMLMERRIILCAHSLSLLTGCAHALLALLYPFEWQHVFIPVLPTSLIDFVCSPLPYIIGINPSCIKQLDDLEMEEAVVIDLEKKKFVRKIGDEASILPSKLFQYLEHSLSSSVISSEYQKSPSRRPQRSRADEIVVNTFMTFFVYLYGDYKRFIKRTVDPATGMMEFQKKDFVKKFSSKSTRRFLGAFHMTQMFENFIEERENPAKAETAAQSLFDKTKISELRERCQEIEIFSSKSKFDRWKIRKGLKK